MGTRSTISIEFADGTIGQVYCHWDGYLSNNGKLLQQYYLDPFKVRELIDLGDLSSLDCEVNIPAGQSHSFQNPLKRITTFYGRDRGYDSVAARYYQNFEQYLSEAQFEEYNYILRLVDGQAVWFVSYYETGEKFIKLVDALAIETKEEMA